MTRSLAGLLLFFTVWGNSQAALLWLEPETKIEAGFVRLSDVVIDAEGDRYEHIFLGQISQNEEKKIYLSYISKRLTRFGYLTLTPKVKNGLDFVVVKGVLKEELKASTASKQTKIPSEMMVVVKDSLERGTILRANLLELVPLTENNEDSFASIEDVLGYELERNLSKGATIKPRYISRPPLIHKGDAVKVIIRTPGIEISGIAKALEDGNLGETINIRRQNESLQAKILDEQTVLVQGPQ